VHGHLATAAAAAVLSAGFVTVAEPVTIPLLRRAAIDMPSLRSSHSVPAPRGGGAPVAARLILAVALVPSAAAVTLAAVVLAAWITAFVNAFNFMDGVNGISGAHALAGGACYAALGLWRPEALLAAGGAAVAAGAAAFLPWNAVRARVFLGDAGSYGLGAALAVLAAVAVVLAGLPPEAALGPLALYLADTAWTLQRRIRAGEPWLQAHRTHAYQRLTDAGWSRQRVAAVTGALTAGLSLLGAVSLAGDPLARAAADLAALALLAAYLRAPAWLGQPARPVLRPSEVVTQPLPAGLIPAPRPAPQPEPETAPAPAPALGDTPAGAA
jgi:UDP-GlcNAc:undecaprenyl-phosphate GlcNAc-1-phosphate transferase